MRKMAEADNRKQAEEYFKRAYQFQTSGAVDQAIEHYRKSIELHPTAEAHTFLGWAYSFQGRYEDAIAECKRAIKIDPHFGNPYNDIGAYLIEKGKMNESIPWFKKALRAKRYDSYCYPHYNLGRVYERKGFWKEALKSYIRSIEANPSYLLGVKAKNRMLAFFN